MTYDGFTLAAVIAELKHRLVGGRVQKVRQHNPTDVTLEIRGPGHTYLLFMSVDARFSRVYLTASSGPVPMEAPNFCMLLRKHVQGTLVTAIDQVGMDRIMRITIEYPDHTKLYLILELMGKHSNCILTDAHDRILGAAKHVGSTVSRYRQVLPGRDYIPPPGEEKIDPRALDAQQFDSLWAGLDTQSVAPSPQPSLRLGSECTPPGEGVPTSNSQNATPATASQIKSWLMNTFSGFGPFLADELVARASTNGDVSRDAVREEMLQIGRMAREGSFMPVFVTDEKGRGVMVYPMPSVQYPADRQHARASINEALDTLFRSLVSRSVLEEDRTQLLTTIRRALASRKQALKSIKRTLKESENAQKHRQTGELLLADLHTFSTGAKSVTLANYFDPEMPEIEIELDEKLTPQQNAERYFKRYQKARDSVSTAEQRRLRITRETEALELARQEAESARTTDSLSSLRKTLVERDLLRQEVSREKQEVEFGGERIRRYLTPEGWEILYGENAKANDYLTQRVARPNDVWLHARQITGAHVVVRTAGHSGGVPRPVLSQAAKIAAQNSDAKHSSLVPVDYTLRKHVRKPRGSAPGLVTYKNEKTIDIDPKA